MQTFSVHHTLSCPNRSLAISHQNEIRDEIIHLARQYLPPNSIRGELLIHLDHSKSEEEVHHGGSVPETQGYSQSGAYGRAIHKRSLASGVDMLTRILGCQMERISFWLGKKA